MNKIRVWLQEDRLYCVEMAFKLVYMLHLLASFNPYIDGTPPLTVTLLGTMALGGFLLLCRLLDIRVYFRTPGLPVLLLFLISFAVPSLLIYRYALIDSIKTLVWMTLQFCLLFAFSTRRRATRMKKELAVVGTAVGAVITLENAVSLWMAFSGYFKVYQKPDGTSAVTGLAWWGRLYGVHGDPTYACVYTPAALLFCVYLFLKYPRWWVRVATLAAAAINFMFVSFSASRTGLVCLILGVAVFTLSYGIGYFKGHRRRILKSIAAVMLVCFGLSWPINAMKAWKSRTAAGTSWAFLALITFGYLAGIAAKFASGSINWVLAVYFINLAALIANWIVFARNKSLGEKRQAFQH